MKGWLRKESGLSLVELLATIVIAAILVSFIMSIFIFMQKKSDSQKDEVSGLSDITIALKSITKDIRYADDVEIGDSTLTIKQPDKTVEYHLNSTEHVLVKDNTNYIYDVQQFTAEMKESTVFISMTSKSGKTLDTEIVLRGGSESDE